MLDIESSCRMLQLLKVMFTIKLLEIVLKILGYKLIRNAIYIMFLDTILFNFDVGFYCLLDFIEK